MAFNLLRMFKGGTPAEPVAADHTVEGLFENHHPQGDEYLAGDATSRTAGPGTENQTANQVVSGDFGKLRMNQGNDAFHGGNPLDAGATARTAGPGAEQATPGILIDMKDQSWIDPREAGGNLNTGGQVGQSLSQNDVVDYVRGPGAPGQIHDASLAIRDAGSASHDATATARTAGPGPENQTAEGIVGHGMLPERGLVENQTAEPDATARNAGHGMEHGQLGRQWQMQHPTDGEIRALGPHMVQWEVANAVRDEGPTTLLSHVAGTGDLDAFSGDSAGALPLHQAEVLRFEDVVHHSPAPDAPHGALDLPVDADIDPLDI